MSRPDAYLIRAERLEEVRKAVLEARMTISTGRVRAGNDYLADALSLLNSILGGEK